jgi:hypothetical protein
MKTNKPFIETLYLDELYPVIIGNAVGYNTINVYDENFLLVKSIANVYNKFIINLDDVIANSEAFTFTATQSGKTESDYSKIIVKRTYLEKCQKTY